MSALCALGHPTPRQIYVGILCRAHHGQLEQWLAEMPALIVEVSRYVQAGSSVGQRVSGTRDKPLPINETASDAWRFARDVLASWSCMVAEELEVTAPLPMIDNTSRFLLRHLEWISGQTWVTDLMAEVKAAVGGRAASAQQPAHTGLRGVLTPVRTRRVPLGPCEAPVACDVLTRLLVPCAGILRALISTTDDELPQVITCSDCGATFEPHQWRALSRRLRKDAEPMLTLAQISQVLHVAPSTLYRWAAEEKWPSTPRGIPGKRPVATYNLGQAQASYDRRDTREEAS